MYGKTCGKTCFPIHRELNRPNGAGVVREGAFRRTRRDSLGCIYWENLCLLYIVFCSERQGRIVSGLFDMSSNKYIPERKEQLSSLSPFETPN